MYNFEEKIKRFVEDYATALIGSKEYYCEIETEGELIELAAVSTKVGGGKQTIITFNKAMVVGIDEQVQNSQPFPLMFVSAGIDCAEGKFTISSRANNIFLRYCSILVANECLANTEFEVVTEVSRDFSREFSMEVIPMRTNYLRFFVNPTTLQRYVEIYFAEGGMWERYFIDYRKE